MSALPPYINLTFLRALRGARDFRVLKDYYQTNTSDYTQDKVVTKTDAYLYVTDAIKTTEYKVINRGDYSNPKVEKVQFKDTDTQVIRKYIPCYEEDGKLEIIYSNVKLTKEQLSKFTPVSVTLSDKKNLHCINHKDYSKSIKHTNKEMKDILISNKEAKKLNKSHLNIVIEIDDPIGEIEDLYEELECSFHTAYAHNKPLIDRIKQRNAYAYSVANFMDELEVNSKEKQERKKTKKKLKDAYYTLVEGMKEDFIPYIIDTCKDRGFSWSIKDSSSSFIRLNIFVEHDVAMSYLNEVKLNASFLLNTQHNYNTFDGRRIEHLNEKCIIESKSHDYLCLGVRAHINGSKTSHKYEMSTRESYTEITALTLFSLYFSGKHNDVIGTKYKDAIEEFHYNLKKLSAHPEFEESVQEEINDKLKDSPYTKLFQDKNGKRSDTFIDEYSDLDTTAKYCAYDWKEKGHIKEFKSLIPKEETFKFFYDKYRKTPKTLSEELSKQLINPELKTLLKNYSDLKDTGFERMDLLLNIAYSLTASRTMFDDEVTQTSAFNTNSAVLEFMKEISIKLQSIDESEHEKLYKEDIFTLYHQNLHGIILHALVKGEYNENEFSSRKSNANKFLDELAPEIEKEYKLVLSNLNDGNISKDLKVKKAHEKLFEQLKALDGITSKIHEAEDKQKEADKDARGRGIETTKTKEKLTILRKSKPYKLSISTMKGLSFFITLFTTGDALKTYKKNDLKALLEITTGINSITKTVVETGTKVLPRTKQAMIMVDFLLAEHSVPQKIIAKLAIPAVVVGAYYEMVSLEDEDYDAMLMIGTKAAIIVALAFVSGMWIAAIGYIALEILWYIFSGYFIDSRVEVMIEKSLFYQDGRKPYILESLSTTTGNYYIRRGSRDALMQAKDITKIGGTKEVREFIYKNYSDNKQALQAAARYEFSEIYRALKNISIEVEKVPTYFLNFTKTMNLNLNGYLRVNKDYYEEMEGLIYLIKDDNYTDYILIDATEAIDKENDKLIDIFTSFKEELSEAKLDEDRKKNYTILIASGITSVKYKLDIKYNSKNDWLGTKLVKEINYYLNELIPMPLSPRDLELLK
ncbi:hypothetical protein [Sulfurimonas sp.]|uniref:hypothetical protein n=1 Tax=Sulfurimonas sp. TaxID=2022749 RepID=UPI002B45C9D1|nr:hypothetical protein [Sulfurimonas sp.]